MAKNLTDEVKKKVKEQDEENYGEESYSGSSPAPGSDSDTAKALGEMLGREIKEGEEFDLAETVKKEEDSRRGK